MTTYELSNEQMTELMGNYICEIMENPSYGELSCISINENTIHEYYKGVNFSGGDFLCTAGA